MRYAYHATTEQAWLAIQQNGLQPQQQADPTEARCLPADEPATFFCPLPEWAQVWGDVVVRFPWPADAEQDGYGDSMLVNGKLQYTNWYTQLPVPPDHLTRITAD